MWKLYEKLWGETRDKTPRKNKKTTQYTQQGCGAIEIQWRPSRGCLRSWYCGWTTMENPVDRRHPMERSWTDQVSAEFLGWVAFSAFILPFLERRCLETDSLWGGELSGVGVDYKQPFAVASTWRIGREKAWRLSCWIRALTPMHWQRHFRLLSPKQISIVLCRLRIVRRGAVCCWRIELGVYPSFPCLKRVNSNRVRTVSGQEHIRRPFQPQLSRRVEV